MPVMMCAGRSGCDRMISISAVPGGNPAAKADPEGYASEWALCAGCRSYTCDRCHGKQQGKCACGAALRIFSETERIQVAGNLSRGLPALGAGQAPPASAPAKPAAPVSVTAAPAVNGAPQGGVPVRSMLEATMHQIDTDLATGNKDRARAMAAVAGAILATQGGNVTAAEVAWLMHFGERFYLWRTFVEGYAFWKGLRVVLKRLGMENSEESSRALATQLAFHLIGGDLSGSEADIVKNEAAYVARIMGPAHPLTRDVYGRVGGSPPAEAPPAAAPPPPPAAMKVAASAQPAALAALAGLDASSRLALWVTLAFLDVAASDGKVGEGEFLAWKNTMARMQLPDVWQKFGTQGLQDLLLAGALQQLSADLATLPPDARAKMAGVLIEFMMADGKAEAQEIQAIKRIGGWLGVTLQFG